MADEEKEIIYHFMFPLKTPADGEAAPGMIRRVSVDEDGEPIEDETEAYSRLYFLSREQCLKLASYHQRRGEYHLALAEFAKKRADELPDNSLFANLEDQSSDKDQ